MHIRSRGLYPVQSSLYHPSRCCGIAPAIRCAVADLRAEPCQARSAGTAGGMIARAIQRGLRKLVSMTVWPACSSAFFFSRRSSLEVRRCSQARQKVIDGRLREVLQELPSINRSGARVNSVDGRCVGRGEVFQQRQALRGSSRRRFSSPGYAADRIKDLQPCCAGVHRMARPEC